MHMYVGSVMIILQFFCSYLHVHVAGLGEFRIRDLNDEINKLLREKRHWEERILELGGPDHNVRSMYLPPHLHVYTQ